MKHPVRHQKHMGRKNQDKCFVHGVASVVVFHVTYTECFLNIPFRSGL
jgi:hypothetical protein